MDKQADADERTYWVEQVRSRSADLQAAEERNELSHVRAGLRLRLQEAELRVEALARINSA